MNVPLKTISRISFALLLLNFIAGCSVVQKTVAAAATDDSLYRLVWADEFNGAGIDTTVWTFDKGAGGWGNHEHEFYQPANAVVQDGNLIITAKKESAGTASYTSTRMKTQNRKSFLYGRIEARMNLPNGQGLWPAFWLLGENISTVGWPKCGEIDIMEHINADSLCHGTAHWDKAGHVSSGSKTVFNPSGYHVYDVEWTKETITWHVDGIKYGELSILNSTNNVFPFHSPFFILLNLAVGGDWPGHAIDDGKLPASLYVDYVRVYQRK